MCGIERFQFQPQSGYVPKPRVGIGCLPWECGPLVHQPQRGCATDAGRTNGRNPVGVVFNLRPLPKVARPSQPWAMFIIHHHLNEVASGHGVAEAATPLGLIPFSDRSPRVARASQPWAGGRSPVGAGEGRRVSAHPSHESHWSPETGAPRVASATGRTVPCGKGGAA